MEYCKKVEGLENAVDIVGMEGDGLNTVDISTGAAILAAACGARVAKVCPSLHLQAIYLWHILNFEGGKKNPKFDSTAFCSKAIDQVPVPVEMLMF